MTNHLARLRADSSHAESVIREIFNGLPVTVQRGYLEFLSSSLEFLSTAYSDRWGTSLFKGKIRLNVGWVEALTLRTDGLYVLVEKESAPAGTRFAGVKYQYAPGCDLTKVSFSRIPTELPALSDAHLSAISIIAKRKPPKSIRGAHSQGVIVYMEKFLKKRVPNPSYRLDKASGHNYLVLWKYSEAENVRGKVVNRARGTHATGLTKDDRMFIVATTQNELYLLGVIEVERSGRSSCTGESLFGTFDIIPLKGLKWLLRFESALSQQLSSEYPLARQVRSRRILTPESAELLEEFISEARARKHDNFVVQEGKAKQFTLTKRERDPRLRAIALARRGSICEICEFNFEKVYGDFAARCVEVHHTNLLSHADDNGTVTSVDDLIVLCPNCHRALHRYRNPKNWAGFKKDCGFE